MRPLLLSRASERDLVDGDEPTAHRAPATALREERALLKRARDAVVAKLATVAIARSDG